MRQIVSKALYGIGACISACMFAPTASATYDWYHWQTQQQAAADPDTINGSVVISAGAYDPFVIGEDIEFNACSTTFAGYSLCDLPDTSKFTIQWQAKTLNEQGQTMLYDSGVCNPWNGNHTGSSSDNCLNVTVAGNTSSSVFTSDEFYIGIHIAVHSNYYIPLPNGEWAYTGNGGQYGWMWTGAERTSASNTGGGGSPEPSPVPEPLAPFLLLPALLYVIRREYLKKRPVARAA